VNALFAIIFVLTVPTSVEGRINLVDFARVVQFTGDSPDTFEVHELERGADGWEAWTDDEGQYIIGVEWDEPRDLAEVEIEFRHAIAHREQIKVQYFQNHWPHEQAIGLVPPDDPFHGQWVTAKAEWWAGDRDVGFAFVPYNQEQPAKGAPAMRYRRTYRLRFLLGKRDHKLPPVRYLRAYGPNEPEEATFDIRLGPGSPIKLPIDVSVLNGYVLEQDNAATTQTTSLDTAPARLRVRFADGAIQARNRTVVTIRNRDDASQGMSFLPAEAVQYGIIRVPSLGVAIAHVGSQKDLQIDRRPRASRPAYTDCRRIRDVTSVIREITRRKSTTQPKSGTRLSPGMQAIAMSIDVPEPQLNEMYKSELADLIATARLSETSSNAATNGFDSFEAMCRSIRVLNFCGFPNLAERLVGRILDGQSRRPLQGRFTSKSGAFGALTDKNGHYQPGNSNMGQGLALVALNEHHRFTRKARRMMNMAERLIDGCDFISDQRRTGDEALTLSNDDLLWGRNLLPPGPVDKAQAWYFWFAVNAQAYRGMQMTAESLTEINDPDADRITKAASTFGKHLRQSCKEAMVRAPVVRLHDGTYVPQQPARSRCRGWDLGLPHNVHWGPMHLIECGIHTPDSLEAQWIRCSEKDQVNETKFVPWLRQLLIAEHNDRLELLAGVPAHWLKPGKKIIVRRAVTWFGPMDMTVESKADPRQIVIALEGPKRNPPQTVRLYIRTPRPIAAVTCNGHRLSTFKPATGIIDLPRLEESATIVISY